MILCFLLRSRYQLSACVVVRFLRVVSVSDTPASLPVRVTTVRNRRETMASSARALDLDLQMIRRRSVGLSIKPFTAAAEAQRPTNIEKVFSLLLLIAESLVKKKKKKKQIFSTLDYMRSSLLLIIIITIIIYYSLASFGPHNASNE